MLNLRSTLRVSIPAIAIVVLATALWVGHSGHAAAAQGTTTPTCAPTATDGVDASTIQVTGLVVSWAAHPSACAYRVILSNSPSGERVDTLQSTANTTYTMPSGSMVTGKKYKLTIRILDAEGRPAGLETRYWFHFHPDLPQCAISLDSSVAAVPTPTPNPTLASSSCNLLPAQKDVAVVVSGDPDASAAITPVLSYATSKIRRAAQSLKCTSSGTCSSDAEGITAIDGSIMTQAPRKPTAGWAGYHNFNNMSVSNPAKSAIDCSTANRDGDLDGTDDDDEADDKLPEVPYTGPESIVVGFVTGDFAGRIYQNELLVAAYYRDQQLTGQTNKLRCVLKRTHIQNDQHTGIYVQIGHIGSGWWAVRAWYDEWVEIARFHTSWEEAPAASHGHEIWADNLHFHQVPAPLNQISRVSLTIDGSRLPWYEKALPTDFRRRSQTLVVGTLAVSDNRGFDHTSITTCATKPGTNFCYAADRSLGRIRLTPAQELDIVVRMMGELHTAVTADQSYRTAELDFLTCGEAASKTTDQGRAVVQPFTFSSFDALLENYTPDVRAKIAADCPSEESSMFSTLQSVSRTKLAELKNSNAEYRAFLQTERGRLLEDNIGNPDVIKVYALLIEPVVPATPTSRSDPPGTGGDCLASDETADTVAEKLDVLNCLVFDTPMSFWETQAMRTQQSTDLAENVNSRYGFLGLGDWECSFAPEQPFLPSCLEHDVAYSSLKKFVRNFIPLPEPIDFNRDAAWHPKNKLVADLVLLRELRKNASDVTVESCNTWLPSGWNGIFRSSDDLESVLAFYVCSGLHPTKGFVSRLEASSRASVMFVAVTIWTPPHWYTETASAWLAVRENSRFEER